MLHAVLHGLGLQQLGGIDQVGQLPGVEVHLGQVGDNPAVGGGVALVLLHHIGEDIPVFGSGEGLDGFHAGEALETELGDVAEQVVAVVGEGLQTVPHIPVVHIAPVGVLGLVKAAAAGGGGGPVEGLGVLLL